VQPRTRTMMLKNKKAGLSSALRILGGGVYGTKYGSFCTLGKSRLFSSLGHSRIPEPYNEPLLHYAPGSKEVASLQAALKKLRSETIEIPCIINGQEVKTGDVKEQRIPSDHSHVVAHFHQASSQLLEKAIEGAMEARAKWAESSLAERSAIFLKAADLLSTTYRWEILAATMLGQGKTVWQAEIDGAAETIDFFRFNPKFAEEIYDTQPPKNSTGVWNRMEYRPLEGFVVAISPFNFTAIGANLPSSPALMGNVVVWKPASTAVLSNYVLYKVLRESGLPPGVIQFTPASGQVVGEKLINSPHFAGLHFTGSTGVFNGIMAKTAENLKKGLYKGYPRIVGETGGKDFHFIHESADISNVVHQTIRGAFEYQGQKCSACSRAYMPASRWDEVKRLLVAEVKQIKMGQPEDFSNFMTAVIDKSSFNSIKNYITEAKQSKDAEIIVGGGCDDSKGYFIEPTVVVVKDPKHKLMREEIFGPVLTIYVYPTDKGEKSYLEALELCDSTSPYALTGSLFAKDRYAVSLGEQKLRNASGNFYINDKSTGAIVGQQPFGGARASGTNDKAGSHLNLLRWVSVRAIKENFVPLTSWRYPHMN